MTDKTISCEGLYSIAHTSGGERVVGRMDDGRYVLVERRRQPGALQADWRGISDPVTWETIVIYAEAVLAGSSRAISHPPGMMNLALGIVLASLKLDELAATKVEPAAPPAPETRDPARPAPSADGQERLL